MTCLIPNVGPTLNTDRLTLRPFGPGDEEELWRAVMQDAAVMKTLSVQPKSEAEERSAAAQYIEVYAEPWETVGYGGWAVCARSDDFVAAGTMLGFCGFEHPQIEDEGAELGFGYSQAWWGQGLGFEAAACAVDWYFRVGGHAQFYACHDPDNHGSRRILESVGMVAKGELDLWDSVARGVGKMPYLTHNRESYFSGVS